jgi:hypothetical protein
MHCLDELHSWLEPLDDEPPPPLDEPPPPLDEPPPPPLLDELLVPPLLQATVMPRIKAPRKYLVILVTTP